MRFFPRRFGLLLVCLFAGTSIVFAQGDGIKAVGSGIVEPLLRALVSASGSEATFNIEVTGSTTGFEQFCAGEADITTATRQISTQEKSACADNGVNPVELVLGQDILAFITNPDADFAACLTGDELSTIYAPSAEGEITNWNQVLPDAPDLALTVFAPNEFTTDFTILDSVIEGAGIRSDATVTDDPIGVVSQTSGSIGVVSLPKAQAAGSSIQILELDAASVQGCQVASAESAEDGLYPAATKLYLYANAANLDKPGLKDFLTFATDSSSAVVEGEGLVAPTQVLAQTNQDTLQAALTGQLPTAQAAAFSIPPGLSGQLSVRGSAEGFDFLQTSTTGFKTVADGVTVDTKLEGAPAGFRNLCNGEADIAFSYRDLTADETANCQANNIETMPVSVGPQAIVLVANAKSDYLTCLTTEQIATIWRADARDSIMTWNQVSDTLPDQNMTLFSPDLGNPDIDLLMLTASGQSLIERTDIELNDDPLYRAAATANVEGALTYLSWPDYQAVLANDQANIQLVQVDGGNGCVEPSLSTIRDDSYPLTRQEWLIVNKGRLTVPTLESFLWYAFSEDNIHAFQDNGFVGVRSNDLATTREALVEAFDQATIAAMQAEATPEVTAEATVEATPEATAEATQEASQ